MKKVAFYGSPKHRRLIEEAERLLKDELLLIWQQAYVKRKERDA